MDRTKKGTCARDLKNYILNYLRYGIIGDCVGLEASTLCQLHCPSCPQVTNPDMGILGKGFLTLNNFKSFVDTYPTFKRIELSNYGELFLNPELRDIITYAHEKNITLSGLNGVNFNTVSDDMLECLVRYQFHALLISIDGATEETYREYRRGGSLHAVLENIRKLNNYKKKHRSVYPILHWQFIVFEHNKHEIHMAQNRARELGMSFSLKEDWSRDRPIAVDEEGAPGAKDISLSSFCFRDFLCFPHINWDGTLLGCCVNMEKSFGNVFIDGLRFCVKRPDYQLVEDLYFGRKKHLSKTCCSQCVALKEGLPIQTKILPKWFLRLKTLCHVLKKRIYESQ